MISASESSECVAMPIFSQQWVVFHFLNHLHPQPPPHTHIQNHNTHIHSYPSLTTSPCDQSINKTELPILSKSSIYPSDPFTLTLSDPSLLFVQVSPTALIQICCVVPIVHFHPSCWQSFSSFVLLITDFMMLTTSVIANHILVFLCSC